MIRILGSVFNISFQTELLIMTLLGLVIISIKFFILKFFKKQKIIAKIEALVQRLFIYYPKANSTLDWKPFDLVSKLHVIEELHFPARSDGEISGNFIPCIKKLLTLTVVVQFFCSLLNPLAYLLKLYPIITWSRADVLLPWLTIHALNTILPKLMSMVLAFIFYFESMITSVTLLEFLVVETINLLIAWCNWYLFFDFYMDLRKLERKRLFNRNQKVRRSLQQSGKSSVSSSIPNLKLDCRESSSELRPIRSDGGLADNLSRSIKCNRNSLSSLSSDEALTPAEKTIKILSLTDEELQSARVRKGSLNKVLSNTDTLDVELIHLTAPDEISYASLANTDDSVIIVYDSQDEKELKRLLAPVKESELEFFDSRRRTTSEIAEEDLLRELLNEEKSVEEDKSEEEPPLECKISVSSPIKVEVGNLLEEEPLFGIKDLLKEERSLQHEKQFTVREEDVFDITKLEVARDGKFFKRQGPDLPKKDDEFDQVCVCSSSEDDDDDDEEDEAPINTRPDHFLRPLPVEVDTMQSDDFKRKEHYNYAKRKKTKNRFVQTVDYPDTPLQTLLLSPSSALVPRIGSPFVKREEKDLNCLLNENFQLLDKMCRAMNFSNNHSIPNNNLRKWLVFRHQLESSLDHNPFTKKDGSVIDLMKPRPIGYFNVKDKNTQTEATLRAKKRHKEKCGTLLHYPKTEVIESKWNYVENFPGTSTEVIGKSFPSHQEDKSVEPLKVTESSVEKIPHFINIVNFRKTISASPLDKKLTQLLERPGTCDDRERTSISILKTKVPMKCSELECFKNQKDKDLRNLQAYNKLTLEQDNRELMQKKKKSKMTSYKNAVTELTLQNSDVVPNRLVKVDNRTCKSNHSRTKNTAHSSEQKNRNFNQLFKYNEKLFDHPADTQEITENPDCQHLEIESCKPKATSPAGTPALPTSRSDTKIPPQDQFKKAEGLEQIDWLDPPSNSTNQLKPPQVSLRSEIAGPQHTVIVDDETVSMLKNAFSFSDESDRGFQLGPEMHEPYPIFQVVALTMAEIFKATGWRNFEESVSENPCDAPVADVMFCEAELDSDSSDDVANVLDELLRVGEEELERRKSLSVSLLEQLHELLKSSRETLSEVESCRSLDDIEDRFDFPDELCVKDDNIVDGTRSRENCEDAVNEQISSNPLKKSKNQKTKLPTEISVQNETVSSNDPNSRVSSANRNDYDSGKTALETSQSRFLEDKVSKCNFKKEEGLLPKDSEERALNLINQFKNDDQQNESTEQLIETFNSFCDKFMESEDGDVVLEKNLKTLAKSDKFTKLMKIFKEKMSSDENEGELSSSDFASAETVREVFVESRVKDRPVSGEKKKENPAKLKNKELSVLQGAAEKLKNHREHIKSDEINQRILHWRSQSADSMNSLDCNKKRKLEETRTYSDDSDIEEFSVN